MRKKKILIVAVIAIIIASVFLWLLCREVKGSNFVKYEWSEGATTRFLNSDWVQTAIQEA